MRPSFLALVCAILLPAASVRPPPSGLHEPTTHEVRMVQEADSFHFEPARLTIRRGDSVRFVTVSGPPHNVAFEADSIPGGAAATLDAGMPGRIAPLAGPLLTEVGESYTVSFADVPPGRYPYLCMPHLTMGMRGMITVR